MRDYPLDAARCSSYPLTPLQHGMLFQSLRAPATGIDVEQAVGRLGEPVDAARLERAWQRAVERHEVLRTVFRWAEVAEPVQVVLPAVQVPLALHDCGALAAAEREARLERYLAEDRARGFDLAEGPVMRLALFRFADDEHVLVWSFHHIVLGGGSVAAVLLEVFALYDAGEDAEPGLPARRPFRDHVEWLRGRDPAADQAYWSRRLRGVNAPAAMPAARRAPRDPAAEPAFGELELRLDAPAEAALRTLKRERGVNLNTVAQGAWALLLGRYTGCDEAVFGLVRGGRGTGVEGVDGMVGMLINTVPVRVPLPPEARVIDWLKALAEENAALRRHEHAALADISRWSGVRGGAALFDTTFNYHTEFFEDAFRGRGGRWARRSFRMRRCTGFGLSVAVASAAPLRVQVDYDADRFDRAAVEAMLEQYCTLLAAIAAEPEAPLGRLALVAPGRRAALLAAGRAMRAFPVRERIDQRFERRAAERPHSPAVTFAGESLTYAELNARANRLAHRLRALGVGPETRVGLCLERSAELVVAILGVLKAGGAYVPLDPEHPAERIAFVLEDAGVPVLVTHSGLLPRLPEHGGATVCLDRDADAIARESAEDPRVGAGPDILAYVIYTSGSTGRPKGVEVTHANVARLFDATDAWFGFGGDDVWTLFHSCAFDFSVWEIWGALLYGGRLVVVPFVASRSPDDFHRLLVDQGVTVLSQTPTAFRQLVQADLASGVDPSALRLRHVVFGGEALDPRALAPWIDRHGDARPRLVNMYGITETTVHVTFRELTRGDLERGGSPIGVPIPDLSLHLLDPHLQPVPPGVPGEICVGGAGVARGYLNRRELTAERFVRDPFSADPAARLYRSGDLARRRADGELEYLGRADQQVKVRGFRIETGEIEAALASHPGVADATVIAREDVAGERRLVAYVVARPPFPAAAELRARLAAFLPDYMVPAAFVTLGELPLTENGKLDRRALPPPEAAEGAAAAGPCVAPRSRAEAALAGVWREVLGVERVGIDDNFFALGGDSILSVRVVAAARRQGLAISIAELFRCQTVRELAAAAGASAEPPDAPAAPFALLAPGARDGLPGDVEDAYPASQVQLAMLYHAERDPASRVYLNLNGYRVHGRFDHAAMRRALRQVAACHPLLRTSFDLAARPEPVQRVHREVEIPLEVADLRHLDGALQDAAFDALASAGFDWTVAPLLRFHVHLLADGVFRLVLAEHHAILDGWSVASLTTELLRTYAALLDGTGAPAPLPPAASFRDFVALEREAVASAGSRAFWRRVVEGAPPSALPPREAGGPPARDEAPCLWVELPAATGAGLRRVAEGAGVPVKTVLLAAHLRVLALLGGCDDVVTGYVTSGRPETEGGERVLGVFLNTVPLRVRVAGGSWLELVGRAWAAEEALLGHRRFPLAEIVREAGGRTPFEAAFNFNHFHVYDGLAGAGVRMAPDRFFQKTEMPLVVAASADPATGALRLRLEYDPARLGEAQVRALGRWYARALASLAAAPEARWDADGLLDEAEQAWLRPAGAGAGVEHGAGESIHALFEARAEHAPEAVAAVFEDRSLGYRELNERANRLAHHLAGLGVGPEVRVGICLERSLEMVVAVLAVLKAGGAYVPLDPGYPAQRLAWMLDDAGVAVLLTRERLRAAVPAAAGVRVVSLDAERGEIAARSAENPAGRTGPRALAYVVYTSGSTGTPKGVGVEHRSVVRLVRGADYADFGPDDVVLQAAPVSFDASTLELWGALLNGARLVLMPGSTPSLEELGHTLRRHRVTTLWLTAGLFQAMVEERLEELGGVRQLLTGGDVVPVEQVATLLRRFPGCRLINGYGPTENTTFTCCYTVPAGWAGGSLPIGSPISGTHAYVLDGALRLVPRGVPGELYAGGTGVARGYLGRPAATAERFVPDPFAAEPGARMYRTGDRVRCRADGVLEFMGRLDGQVKVRGFRVEPGEIEAALLKHPGIERAVVAAHAGGAAGARLAAYVVARGGAHPEAAELRRYLRERLPDYMVPAAFVPLRSLPLTPNGKVDRGALPAAGAGGGDGEAYVAPRTPTERALAALWAEALGVERVGADDEFFALGGHSLLAIRMLPRIRGELGCELGLRAFLDARTLAEVAAAVDAERATGPAAAEAAIPRRPRRAPAVPV
jgi:amino acid adenylation domain-containing protein